MIINVLVFSPDHFVYYTYIRLNDAHDLGGDVLVNIVGHGDAGLGIADELYGHINALQEAFGVDAAEHEAAFV